MQDQKENLLGENLNYILEKRRTTLTSFSKKFNINVSTLHGYANGRIPKNFSSLIRICNEEEISLDDLFFVDLKNRRSRANQHNCTDVETSLMKSESLINVHVKLFYDK